MIYCKAVEYSSESKKVRPREHAPTKHPLLAPTPSTATGALLAVTLAWHALELVRLPRPPLARLPAVAGELAAGAVARRLVRLRVRG